MKTRKLILGSFVLVFAIGSSIASGLLVQPVYVQALVDGAPACAEIQEDCDNLGEPDEPCTIEFTNLSPSTTDRVYDDSSCTNTLTHSSQTIVTTAPSQIQELLEPID